MITDSELTELILEWTDKRQRKAIALEVGITTTQQIMNVIKGRSRNFILKNRLIEQAKINKKLSTEFL